MDYVHGSVFKYNHICWVGRCCQNYSMDDFSRGGDGDGVEGRRRRVDDDGLHAIARAGVMFHS
jgi:hypothetical protein